MIDIFRCYVPIKCTAYPKIDNITSVKLRAVYYFGETGLIENTVKIYTDRSCRYHPTETFHNSRTLMYDLLTIIFEQETPSGLRV